MSGFSELSTTDFTVPAPQCFVRSSAKERVGGCLEQIGASRTTGHGGNLDSHSFCRGEIRRSRGQAPSNIYSATLRSESYVSCRKFVSELLHSEQRATERVEAQDKDEKWERCFEEWNTNPQYVF